MSDADTTAPAQSQDFIREIVAADVAAGSFAVVPRGTSYGFTRRGRNPLIVLAFLAGAPCAGN